MKTVQRKYETDYDKEIELKLGEKYGNYVKSLGYEIEMENQGFLSTYDFKVYYKNTFIKWLEVKKKSGFFSDSEIIPITKWNFAKQSKIPCWMLVERVNKAKLFNITDLIKNGAGQEREIKRRVDQPEGSRKVVFFPTALGRDIYYL